MSAMAVFDGRFPIAGCSVTTDVRHSSLSTYLQSPPATGGTLLGTTAASVLAGRTIDEIMRVDAASIGYTYLARSCRAMLLAQTGDRLKRGESTPLTIDRVSGQVMRSAVSVRLFVRPFPLYRLS